MTKVGRGSLLALLTVFALLVVVAGLAVGQTVTRDQRTPRAAGPSPAGVPTPDPEKVPTVTPSGGNVTVTLSATAPGESWVLYRDATGQHTESFTGSWTKDVAIREFTDFAAVQAVLKDETDRATMSCEIRSNGQEINQQTVHAKRMASATCRASSSEVH